MTVCVTGQPYLTFQKMTRVNVKVQPDSDSFRIETSHIPKFYLEKKAEKGRANKELINKVEQVIDERPGLVSGHHSSRKKLEVSLDKKQFKQKIEDYNG